ncbi:MAG: class I SAM-dependent methyltransferase, partial [Oscillospiraceae bacterium]|nr:class I SAM-dependent methyltransferase [Oscillospiraceae bacterium]
NVPNGGTVLDVGCGNGSLINSIRQKNKIQAYGVDISPNMIEECRKRYEDIKFEVSSGEKLPFESGYFDTVTICCVLHHLNNPRNFFLEAQRILKTGGSLIIGEPWYPFILRQIANYILLPLIKAGDNKIFSHKTLRQYFTEYGFTITNIYKKGIIQIIRGDLKC